MNVKVEFLIGTIPYVVVVMQKHLMSPVATVLVLLLNVIAGLLLTAVDVKIRKRTTSKSKGGHILEYGHPFYYRKGTNVDSC
jgi:hypothetical protein